MKLPILFFVMLAITFSILPAESNGDPAVETNIAKREAAREPVLSRMARAAGTRGQGRHGSRGRCGGGSGDIKQA